MRGVLLSVLAVVLIGPVLLRAEDRKPMVSIRGPVERLSLATDEAQKRGIRGTVFVKGVKEADTSYDQAVVTIRKTTKIEKAVGKERKPATFEDIKKGARVEMVFTGPVRESFPVQADAASVVILEQQK